MEKETFEKAENMFHENVENSQKWFNTTTSLMIDAYTKQFNLGLDIYKKWLDTPFNVGLSDDPLKFYQLNIDFYKKNSDKITNLSTDMIKTTLESFNKQADSKQYDSVEKWYEEIVNTITETFNKQTKLAVEFNENYFDTVKNQFKDVKIDFDTYSENLQNILQNNVHVSEESIKTILETYSKQKDWSSETNDKMLKDINKLTDFMTKSMLTFWTEMLDAISVAKAKEAKTSGPEKENWHAPKATSKNGKKPVAKVQTV